jgi:hypothetical protein
MAPCPPDDASPEDRVGTLPLCPPYIPCRPPGLYHCIHREVESPPIGAALASARGDAKRQGVRERITPLPVWRIRLNWP